MLKEANSTNPIEGCRSRGRNIYSYQWNLTEQWNSMIFFVYIQRSNFNQSDCRISITWSKLTNHKARIFKTKKSAFKLADQWIAWKILQSDWSNLHSLKKEIIIMNKFWKIIFPFHVRLSSPFFSHFPLSPPPSSLFPFLAPFPLLLTCPILLTALWSHSSFVPFVYVTYLCQRLFIYLLAYLLISTYYRHAWFLCQCTATYFQSPFEWSCSCHALNCILVLYTTTCAS